MVAEVLLKEAVITSSLAKIIYVMGEITFKVAVMTSLEAKFSLFAAKITFVVAENEMNRALGHLCAHIG